MLSLQDAGGKESKMRTLALLAAAGVVIALAAGSNAAGRSPWSADRVDSLVGTLIGQTESLEGTLREQVKAAEAATFDPDRQVGVGKRNVALNNLVTLKDRLTSYREAVAGGQDREETRQLFGRLEAQVGVAAGTMRALPDFASYRPTVEAMEKTLTTLARFYAESLDVKTPPDPLDRKF